MAQRVEASPKDVRALFERGDVYADRWSPEVRSALDVADPLTDVVTNALEARQSVVLSGNAGDGKSHLAQRALDRLPARRCLEVTARLPVPSPIPADSLIFIRDASSLSYEEVLTAARSAQAAGAPLLITVNEGPLAVLAQHPDGSFFRNVRAILHARALGEEPPDPPGCLVLSLSGRQLTRGGFIQGALDKLLPMVGPCGTCGRSSGCPRVIGARLLRRSRRAKERLELLLRLLSDSGQHLSAREIWVFLIDLFFGWTCPPGGEDVDRLPGYFWMRIFEGSTLIATEISRQFDPVVVPLPREDVALWQGRFDTLESDVEYPGSRPVVVARELGESSGLRAFGSAKRWHFFFGKTLDVERILARRSLAPHFGKLLEGSMGDSRPVIRELVGLMNRYRLSLETENELWISRHHGFAAHRRPAGLGAAGKLPIDRLHVRVPFRYEADRYERAGFFPTKLFLHWKNSEQMLEIDFETWQRLRQDRTLTVDRHQETLDFALDLFMAQASVPAVDDPELLVYDHRRREETVLRIRPLERRIEVLR
jgi:hypothetical protein